MLVYNSNTKTTLNFACDFNRSIYFLGDEFSVKKITQILINLRSQRAINTHPYYARIYNVFSQPPLDTYLVQEKAGFRYPGMLSLPESSILMTVLIRNLNLPRLDSA